MLKFPLSDHPGNSLILLQAAGLLLRRHRDPHLFRA
jgi:hypothetical protein